MNILVFSLDKNFLEKDSAVSQRTLRYGDLVDSYIVLIPDKQRKIIIFSDKVKVESSGGRHKIFQFFNLLKLGKKLINQKRPDVISTQDPFFLGLIGIYLRHRFKIGVEIQVHGWERVGWLKKNLSKFILRRADAVRTVSNRLKKELMKKYGVKEAVITVVPILLKPNIEKVPILNKINRFVFLTVGRLVPVKNIGLQIKAAAAYKKNNKDFEWWIIGAGPEKEKLKLMSEKLFVADRVKFLGNKNFEDLAAYYKIADCFVLTSFSEGWGMAVVEAAQAGLPIIMTDVGCAGELIKDNESGLIIKNNLEDLLIAVNKVFNEQKLRQKLSLGSKKAVESLLQESEILNLYLKSWQKAQI